jgi:predicted RNA-binding protein with PIN domain
MNARVVVLVDGSNVARTGGWRRFARTADDHELRRRLVDAICSWAGREDHEVVIAFDGAGPWHAGTVRASVQVEVEGTGATSGDAVLERRARALRDAGAVHWIVSSDRAVAAVAGAGADRVLDSEDFVALLGDPSRDAPTRDEDRAAPNGPAGSSIADALGADARARLERLRRGEP